MPGNCKERSANVVDVAPSNSRASPSLSTEIQVTPQMQNSVAFARSADAYSASMFLGGAAVEVARVAALRGRRPKQDNHRPLLFCHWLAAAPWRVSCTTFWLWAMCVILTIVLIAAGVKVFPLVFDTVPLNLVDSDVYLRYQAWLHAPDAVDYRDGLPGQIVPRSVAGSPLYLIYKSGSGNMLTRPLLEEMQRVERSVVATSGYEDWCRVSVFPNGTRVCAPPLSVVSMFDGSLATAVLPLYPQAQHIPADPLFERINETLAAWDTYVPDIVDSVVGAEYRSYNRVSQVVRTQFMFGLPVEATGNYTEPDQEREKQIKLIDDWVTDQLSDVVSGAGIGGVRILYYNKGLATKATVDQVKIDLSLALGSLCFIFLFVWGSTRSLMVTGAGIGGVLIAFFAANLFYRFVLNYKFFGIFHVLSIFIILGIGADDVFVFFDAWMQSKAEPEHISGSLELRLSWTYRRSISAILVTSATTMASFLSAARTQLLAMHTFGLYSALLVLFNFLIVCTLFPCAIALWDRFYIGRKMGCLRCSAETPSSVQVDGKSVSPAALTPFPSTSGTGTDDDDGQRNQFVVDGGSVMSEVTSCSGAEEEKMGFVDKVCYDVWGNVVTHPRWRLVILTAFAGLIGVFVYGASQLEVDKEAVKIWKPGSNWEDFKVVNSKEMMPSKESDRVQVIIVWGLRNQDRSVCDGPTDFLCEGRVVWDESFDLNPLPAQFETLSLCEKIRTLKHSNMTALRNKLAVKLDRQGEVELTCFMESVHNKYMPFGYPITRDTMVEFAPALIDSSPWNSSSYYRWFEMAAAIMAGLTTTNPPQNFSEIIDFQTRYAPLMGADNENRYGAQMRYAAVAVETTMLYPVAFEDGLPVNTAWEEYISDIRNSMAPPLKSVFHIGRRIGSSNSDGKSVEDNSFHWMKVQETLVQTAISGIILGLVLALIVLVLATGNVIVGVLATMTIVLIVIMVLGIIYFAGWKIGVLESLNLTLVVGLSVDYVVHLAHAYTESTKIKREEKIKEALLHVGGSVLSGAFTTLGSSLFMLFAKILFFFQFGLIVFATIGFSCVYALVFFPAMMSVLGPQGEKGELPLTINYTAIRKRAWELFNRRGRRGFTVSCEVCEGSGWRFVDTDDQAKPEVLRHRQDILGEAARIGAITREEYTTAICRISAANPVLMRPSSWHMRRRSRRSHSAAPSETASASFHSQPQPTSTTSLQLNPLHAPSQWAHDPHGNRLQ
eukprot:TRINITY_DN1577_c0_g1_i1.p1 TRINITY_DN1577_c0_g1~~TRINITY_DN1577_c0_g1_i1.p1  ORF type:complete len:1229 (+),score=201.00 TRINITY_DN1577_c0_g1_i1:165-3851(+)